MKKLLALLLCLVMVLSLAACGGSGEEETEKPEEPEEPVKQITVEGTKLETPLWTLVYDDQVWSYEEDDLTDNDDYCSLDIMIPLEEGYEISVEIQTVLEEVADYRETLATYGFELEKAAQGEYDTEEVGGAQFYKYNTTSWGEDVCHYVGRDEGAGATLSVSVYGTYDERVDTLLEGLLFTQEDVGNEDAPWPWEGEPFAAAGADVPVGGYTVTSQWLQIEDPITTFETFDHGIGVITDQAFIVGDGKVAVYDFDGDSFTYDKDLDTDEEFDYAFGDHNGILWLNSFMSDLTAYEGSSKIATVEDLDNVSIAPSGTWGVNWFSNNECELLTISGTTVSKSPITFAEVDTVSHLNVDEDHIYVCGSDEDYEHFVFVYDKQGNLKLKLADSEGEGLGSVTFAAKFEGGYIALDGNLREVVLWDDQGNWLGECEDSDLFETNYPWFCGGAVLEDGSVLVIMTEDRADGSAMELVAFKLTVS